MVAKTDVSTRARQPKGIPIGGEFASNEHGDAPGMLAEEGVLSTTVTRTGRVLPSRTGLTTRELVHEIQTANRVHGRRRDLTDDEIEESAQMTAMELMATAARKHYADEIAEATDEFIAREGRQPDKDERWDILTSVTKAHNAEREGTSRARDGIIGDGAQIDGALVNHVSNIRTGKQINGGKNVLIGENALALTEYKKTVEMIEANEGRRLTSRERDDIARDIRENWVRPKSKPTEGFHLSRIEPSIYALPGSTDDDTGSGYVHPAIVDHFSPEAAILSRERAYTSAAANDALDRIETASGADRSVARREARENAWKIISSESGAPEVAAKIPAGMRKTVQSIVTKAGGVGAIIDAYDRGETGRHIDAIFLPFRETQEDGAGRLQFRRLYEAEQERIVETLRSYRDHADVLWSSALASAK